MSDKNLVCTICGAAFGSTRPWAKCCSDECRAEHARRFSRGWSAAKKQSEPRMCKSCGAEFAPEYGNKRRDFCSQSCLNRHERAQRRARVRGAFVEPVGLGEIIARDGAVCGICGDALDIEQTVPHPLAATIDHVIPLSRGGKHRMNNVQPAHFICNSRKNAQV